MPRFKYPQCRYTYRKTDEGWTVFRPDGRERCTVSSAEFAASIAHDCTLDAISILKGQKKCEPGCKVVSSRTGIVYGSIRQAEKLTGHPRETIRRDILGLTKAPGADREVFRRLAEA